MKMICFLFLPVFMVASRQGLQAQCSIAITYQQGANHLFQFSNATQLPPYVTYRWSLTGPGMADVQTTATANIYLPVNGTYYIELQVQSADCGGQAWDSITVTDAPAPAGNCNAAYTYYPSAGSNYLFADSSTASDSIVNYWWSAHTFNYFAQSQGWGPQTEVSFWSVNCTYQFYILTHYITTLAGCQDSVTDTIPTYCYDCHGLINVFARDSFVPAENKVVLLDSSYSEGDVAAWYWSVNTADTVLYFTDQNPEIDQDTYGRVILYCLNAYDTTNKCAYYYCDSLKSNITGIASPAGEQVKCFFSSAQVITLQSAAAGNYTIALFDMLGRKILGDYLPAGHTRQLHVENLPAGNYLMQVTGGQHSQAQKITKTSAAE